MEAGFFFHQTHYYSNHPYLITEFLKKNYNGLV